jgi:hypothetical protein
MATAEITSQDTFVEEEPVGMSTEPLDFAPEEIEEDIEEFEEAPVGRRPAAAAASRPAQRARYAQAEPSEGVLFPILLVVSGIILLLGGMVVMSLIQGEANDLTQGLGNWFAENFGGIKK